ncbi:MAG: orotidine-5'-phosphate decarboxylase [Acetobacteraceae bacterium]
MVGDIAERLIVALDTPSVPEAEVIVEKLDGIVSVFKIGFGLLFAPGAALLIERLVSRKTVFLDCKMYDIGETVRRGVARARERGVRFLTVHAEEEILDAAVAGKDGSDFPKILAVTVLTSIDDAALRRMGYALTVEDLVRRRVQSVVRAGCDGIIASARDRPDDIRRSAGAAGLIIATPGIRPEGWAVDDHKRAATPAEAVLNGADYLIVGRPVLAAADPAKAARGIIDEMRVAAARRSRARQ